LRPKVTEPLRQPGALIHGDSRREVTIHVLPDDLTAEQLDLLEDALVDTIVADVVRRFRLDSEGQRV
jgi:hypothetical protein